MVPRPGRRPRTVVGRPKPPETGTAIGALKNPAPAPAGKPPTVTLERFSLTSTPLLTEVWLDGKRTLETGTRNDSIEIPWNGTQT